MTTKTRDSGAPGAGDGDGGRALLLQTIRRIARGNFDALDVLYGLPGEEGISDDVSELAESIGMILVKLEARDFHIELAAEAEQRLKELNQLKDKYLGIAAHDLRNPLSSIRGMSEMLIEMDLDEETRLSFARSINRVSNQMLTLINDLLDVSVIESGGFELRMTEGNLADLALECAKIATVLAREKDITLDTTVEDVPDSRFDADRFRQVVDNLLSNAIKFSKSGTTIRLACRSSTDGTEISVTDQGPGIPTEERDALFDAFQTLSTRPTGGEKSTGLGLSIVKKIVDSHDADIRVESEIGVGTTFVVRVPQSDKHD